MALAHFSDVGALQVEQHPFEGTAVKADIDGKMRLDIGEKQFVDEDVDLFGIPPSIHIGLSKPQGAVGQYTAIEPFVMHLDVPWARAIDGDVAVFKEIF